MSATAPDGAARAPSQSRDGEPALAVVVVGMSAGGLYGFKTLVRALAPKFPGAIVVAHHVAAPSLLPELIRKWTAHSCRFAADGVLLQNGTIYVAPAECHVIINPDATLTISQRERLRFTRPSIDWLFESASGAFGDRTIAVVLSGANSDGTHGARCIERAGGTVIVQDPDSCEFPEMPASVIAAGLMHRRLHPCEMAPAVTRQLASLESSWFSWHPFGEELPASSPAPASP